MFDGRKRSEQDGVICEHFMDGTIEILSTNYGIPEPELIPHHPTLKSKVVFFPGTLEDLMQCGHKPKKLTFVQWLSFRYPVSILRSNK